MKKFITLIFGLLLTVPALPVRADTTWVAAGSVAGVWSAGGSPYMIAAGDVMVEADSALIITEGVTVKFAGGFAFRVQGTLIAIGTETDSIYFTCDPDSTPGGWRGLRFQSAANDCELVYCVIERGRASGPFDLRFGGGIECQNSSPAITDCTIRNNFALIDGGGAYTRESADPVFTRCLFENNTANYGGGGLLCRAASDPQLIDCVVRNNTAASGGGLHCGISSDMIVTDCRIEDNHSSLGGGFYADYANATPVLTNCLFIGNDADSTGGGGYLRNSDAVIRFCVFYENSSPLAGGLHLDAADGFVLNSIIAASTEGTGVGFSSNPPITFEGCTIFGHAGGAVAGNGPAGFAELTRQNLNYDSCDVYFNTTLDPLFVDAAAGDFHLTEDSPCIAAGTTAGGLPVDREGGARPQPAMTLPDQGLYEHTAGAPLQICGELTGSLGPGEFAVTCDLIVPRGMSLTIEQGTSLLFAGDYTLVVEGFLNARGAPEAPILLTHYFDLPGVYWGGIEMIGADDDCRFTNTTIEYAHIPAASGRPHGGGVYLEGSSPSFDESTIRFCRAQVTGAQGGGVYGGENSHPDFTKCVIDGNTAALKGGGLSVDAASSVQMSECTISGNSCIFLGGGLYLDQTLSTFDNCEFLDNHSDTRGGGVYSWWSTPVFMRCVFAGNSCADQGGGIYVNSLAPVFSHCVFSGNSAAGGGGMLLRQASARIKNSIVAFSGGGGLQFDLNCGAAEIEYSNFYGSAPQDLIDPQNGPGGLGDFVTMNFNNDPCDVFWNFSLDPQFADTTARDFQLTAPSACINAGDPFEPFDADSSLADIGIRFFALAYEPSTAFDLLWPTHGLGVDENNLHLRWARSFDEGTVDPVPLYRVQLSRDSLFRSGVFEQTLGDTFAFYSGLLDSTTYWWRVKAIGSNGIARSSTQRYSVYTVEPHPPTPFDLLRPVDGDTMIVTEPRLFCWQQSFDVDGGDFVIYTLKLQGVDTLVTFTDLTDTCLNVVPVIFGLTEEGNVEWWVEASSQDPDTTIECNARFHFFLDDTVEAAGDDGGGLPRAFALHPCYPNPFNGATTIEFDVPFESEVRLRVLNVLGQEVELLTARRAEPGTHRLHWEANDLPSGLYFALFEAEGFVEVRKLMLLK